MKMKSSYIRQRVRLLIIGLMAISMIQALWWFFDQRRETRLHIDTMISFYEDVRLIAQTMPSDAVLPSFLIRKDGRIEIKPELLTDLEKRQNRRLVMYGSEGAFFVIVLLAGIFVIWRALDDEARLREQQDQFFTLVSHELKTPLASLQLTAQTMQRYGQDELNIQRLDRMLNDLSHMQFMVTKILNGAQLSQGKMERAPVPLQLSALVGKVVTDLHSLIEKADAEIVAMGGDEVRIIADPLAVETIIRNLLENAVNAVSGQAERTVRILIDAEEDFATVTIHDTGVGFASGKAPYLFEKFYRTDEAYCGDRKGTGLGLYIVDKLVRAEQGHIQAYSEGLHCGATFTVSLPLAREVV